MKKRKILIMILLTLVTFGIYMIYWSCSTQSRFKAKTEKGFGGGMHFLMCIITFGIYSIYWSYAAGKRIAILGGEDQSVFYLILTIFFGFLTPFLIQHAINGLSEIAFESGEIVTAE